MEPTYPLVADYTAEMLAFDASAFAKMNEPGSERKYTKNYRRLTNRLIQSHLRGHITLAACLINAAGSARVGGCP